MNLTTLQPSAFAQTFTTNAAGNVSADQCVSTIEIPVMEMTPTAVEAKPMAIDDFIAQLCNEDPRLEAALDAGTQWVGRTLYADETDTFRAYRLAAGLSQAQLAKRVGTSQAHIARIESGDNDPGTKMIARLADALNVKRAALFEAVLETYESRHD